MIFDISKLLLELCRFDVEYIHNQTRSWWRARSWTIWERFYHGHSIHAHLVAFGLLICSTIWHIIIIYIYGVKSYRNSLSFIFSVYSMYILVLMVFITTLVLFAKTIILLRRRYDGEERLFRMILRNLVLFPLFSLIYGMLYIGYLILLYYFGINNNHSYVWEIFISSQPFVDAVIFGLNNTFSEEVRKFCLRRKKKNQITSVLVLKMLRSFETQDFIEETWIRESEWKS